MADLSKHSLTYNEETRKFSKALDNWVESRLEADRSVMKDILLDKITVGKSGDINGIDDAVLAIQDYFINKY
jgi:hypothetical protein